MKMLAMANSNVESIKTKNSEKLFYKYLKKKLNGIAITKIVPFKSIYFDLLYIDENSVGLFKFLDTNEDTFSILSEEIIEIIEEENAQAKKLLSKKLDGFEIDCFYVMPYINRKDFNVSSERIIDKEIFEEIINDEISIKKFLSPIPENEKSLQENKNNIIYRLSKEYFIIGKHKGKQDMEVELDYANSKIYAGIMAPEQIENVLNIKYGTTLMQGSTGTGKTRVMLAKMLKLAKLYSNEKFLYITFNKQLANQITKFLRFYHSDVDNVRVMNFHQFVLLLGKKYNLKLNKQSKQSFNREFEKVFTKIAGIYSGKNYFKGIFVDESENLNRSEIEFLRNISHSKKNFFYISYDETKRMTPIEHEQRFARTLRCDNEIYLEKNYRASEEILKFNTNFQNDVNAFSALEIDILGNYFKSFKPAKKIAGEVSVYEYFTTEEMLGKICDIIKSEQEKGTSLSDIGVIYPYSEKNIASNRIIKSKLLIKKALDEAGIANSFSDEDRDNLQFAEKVTLSNIYNCTNLQWKSVIFCHLETMYSSEQEHESNEIKKMLNIIYTATGRGTEKLFVLLNKDENRPGIIDLLSQATK